LQNRASFELFNDIQIVWNKPLYKLGKNDIFELFCALDQSDCIYHQYYSPEWGSLSTDNLKQYFEMRTLPTLESPVSFPQLAYWSTEGVKIPPSYVYVDFRFLECYLTGMPFGKAAMEYTSSDIDGNKIATSILESSERYRHFYETKKVCLDYSGFFKENITKNQDDYFTLSHPTNKHLSFLLSFILQDLGKPIHLNIGAPELLNNTMVPKLGTSQNQYFRDRSVSLELAAKLYYEYFSGFEKSFLSREYENSNYRKLLSE
jgi:hypothetical protein